MSNKIDNAAYENLWLKELMNFADQSLILQAWEPVCYLDKGQFSRVFKIRHKKNGMLAALKFVPNPQDLSDCAAPGSQQEAFHRSCFEASKHEVSIMNRFRGERYIVQYLQEPEFLRRTFRDQKGKEVVQYAVLICMPLYRSSKEWMPLAEANPDVSLQLGLNIARALVAFEKKGVFHRDIKPGNIMLDQEGRFCLSDVGEAKLESDFTTAGFHGTRPYMAPEVLRLEGERSRTRSDHRSDIYSLGIVLYKLYNHNQFPFLTESGALTENGAHSYQKYEKRNKTAGKILYMTDSERARLLRYDGLRLPAPARADARMTAIILKACAYSPKDRYQKAIDLYADLIKYVKAREAAAKKPAKPKRTARKTKRMSNRQTAFLWGSAASLVIVLGAGLLIYRVASQPIAVPTAAPTSTQTAATAAPTPTATSTPTIYVTPTPTVYVTPTPTAYATPTPTAYATPTPTAYATPTPTVYVTPTVYAKPASSLRLDQEQYFVQTNEPLIVSWNALYEDARYDVSLYREGETGPLGRITGPSISQAYCFTQPGEYRIEVQEVNENQKSEYAMASIVVTQGEEPVETDQIRLSVSQTRAAIGEMVDFTVVSDTDAMVLVEREGDEPVFSALKLYRGKSGYQTGFGVGAVHKADFYVLTSDGRKSNTVTVSWENDYKAPQATVKPTVKPTPTSTPRPSADRTSGHLSDDKVERDGMVFVLQKDQTWAVESAKNVAAHLLIPSELDGTPVTAIKENAFKQCRNLQSVSIGEGVTSIGKYAFRNCGSLQTVTLPDSLTSLGANAFAYCRSLKEITIPAKVTEIPYSAFVGCFDLQKVDLPPALVRIDKEAFKECRSLQSITLPDGLIEIEDQAFYHCDALSGVYLPASLTRIGQQVFCNSSGPLENLVFYVPKYMDSYAEKYARENQIRFGYYMADE